MPHLSKTTAPCDCGWISQPLNEPDSAIRFDATEKMFLLRSGGGDYTIYHCPFCGGCFPDSSKPVWAPIIPSGERERMEALVLGLSSAEEILERLGVPDYDEMTYGYTMLDGQHVRVEGVPGVRNSEYFNLSDWYVVEFYVPVEGPIWSKLVIKMLSPRSADEPLG